MKELSFALLEVYISLLSSITALTYTQKIFIISKYIT